MDFTGWISTSFSELGNLIEQLASVAVAALPDSPFQAITRNAEIMKYLGYVNWVIPVTSFIAILQAWLVAVAVFYTWQVILRFARAIE